MRDHSQGGRSVDVCAEAARPRRAGLVLVAAAMLAICFPANAAVESRQACATLENAIQRQVCMTRLRRQVHRTRLAEREDALRTEASGGSRTSGWSVASERLAQGMVDELTQRQDEIAQAGGVVTAEIASAIINNGEIQAGMLAMAESLSQSLTADMVELSEDMIPMLRKEALAGIEDVLGLMLQEDTITNAAAAATDFSLRLSRDLGPALSRQLADSLEQDLGPAMAKIVRDDLGPALNDILADELFPAMFSEMNKALLSSSEEIARRASRGAVVGVIEGFDSQQILDRFDDYVDTLRRETLQDLTDSYDVALTATTTQIEGSVARTGRRLTWLMSALMVLGIVGAVVLVLVSKKAASDFRSELSALRNGEEEARRTTALAIEAAERETERIKADARETEKALELVTEAIKAKENMANIKDLVNSIRTMEEIRPDEGGRALGAFFEKRSHLKVAS